MPGFMSTDIVYSRAHDLILDGMVPRLLECVSQKIPLGDYGDWDHISETLTRDGNVFEDLKSLAPILGIDPTNSAYCPAERTTHGELLMGDGYCARTVVMKGTHLPLGLRRPIGYSLPTSR